MESKQLLKNYFGYDSFISGQEDLINCILSGKDVLGIMPTGSGKSICYQLPGLIFDGLTIVVSPLISLMKDQVNILKASGIDAAYINSSLSSSEYYSVINDINNGKYKIIYIAPERLESEDFLEIIETNKISMVAVDEAHCVSQWGHDFRPSYLKIRDFISKLEGNPVISAFTATATENVKKDIVKKIGLKEAEIVNTGYDRENLYFEVRKPKKKFQELLKILESEEGSSGIIYCNTRKAVEEVSSKLIEEGYNATRYHAGLAKNERNINQEKFILDEKPIIVATNAFGMGIDKSNVNFVIHYNMPKNLENYYQEAGRAGRDGSPAKCILLYSPQDVMINKFLIEKTAEYDYKNDELKKKVINQNFQLLNKIQEYCTTRDCYRQYILNYFGENTNGYCGNCFNCTGDFDELDVEEETFHIISAINYINNLNKSFGKGIITNILKGSNTKKIRDLGFDKSPAFNKLNHKSKEEIALVIDFLVNKKYLRVSGNRYPVIKLGKNYEDIINGLVSLNMKISKDELNTFKEKTNNGKNKSKIVPNIDKTNIDRNLNNIDNNKIDSNKIDNNKMNNNKIDKNNMDNNKIDNNEIDKFYHDDQNNDILFEKLRKLRLKLARDKNIPPFMIFHDSTLKNMCNELPISKSEFLEISGVGKNKLENYGDLFINVIKEYIDESAGSQGNTSKSRINEEYSFKKIKSINSDNYGLKNQYNNINVEYMDNEVKNKLEESKHKDDTFSPIEFNNKEKITFNNDSNKDVNNIIDSYIGTDNINDVNRGIDNNIDSNESIYNIITSTDNIGDEKDNLIVTNSIISDSIVSDSINNGLMEKIKNFVLENESKNIENPFNLSYEGLLEKKVDLLSLLKEGDRYLLAINHQIKEEDIRIMKIFNNLPKKEKEKHGKNKDTIGAFKEFNLNMEAKIIKEKQKYVNFVMDYIKKEINLIDQTINIKLGLLNSENKY